MQSNDRAYYQRREAEERAAAKKAASTAQRAHLELANLYAARLLDEQSGSIPSPSSKHRRQRG